MSRYIKNNLLLIILSFIFILLGIVCILIDASSITLLFSILALIYLVMIGSWMIYSSFKYKTYLEKNDLFINKPLGYLIQGIVMMLAGILIVIYNTFLTKLIIGIILIILPLITLITHENKKVYFKNNFWKFIVGLIFIFAIDLILEIIFIIIGVGFILFALFIIYLLIINYKDKNYPNIITKYVMMYIVKRNKTYDDIGE
ncbi:MAG: hypothetical protein WC006_04400 [Bacilli bacterium]|nr:hypothetical protein [Bacilli bacterium]